MTYLSISLVSENSSSTIHSRRPSLTLSHPPETAETGSPSLGWFHRPASSLPCPGCCSWACLDPEAEWWSAGPRCCRAPRGTGSAGPPSFPEHPSSCLDAALRSAGSLRTREHLMEAPGKKGKQTQYYLGSWSWPDCKWNVPNYWPWLTFLHT